MPAAAVALAASAPVAQWIRADGFYPLGRRFESCRGRFERDELRIAASSRGGSCFGTAPPAIPCTACSSRPKPEDGRHLRAAYPLGTTAIPIGFTFNATGIGAGEDGAS